MGAGPDDFLLNYPRLGGVTMFHIKLKTHTKGITLSRPRAESGRELCEFEFMLVFVQMGDLKYGFIPVGGMRGHWWPAEGTERGEKMMG